VVEAETKGVESQEGGDEKKKSQRRLLGQKLGTQKKGGNMLVGRVGAVQAKSGGSNIITGRKGGEGRDANVKAGIEMGKDSSRLEVRRKTESLKLGLRDSQTNLGKGQAKTA